MGIEPAAVVSAGRGYCCDGLDPNFRVPPGIAAWDIIRFTVPDGVVGCYIPVVVQIGTFVSNLATISIDPSGAACTVAPSTLPPELVQKLANQTGYAQGSVSLSRVVVMSVTAAGVVNKTTRDGGGAAFFRAANVPASIFTSSVVYPNHVCTIDSFPTANGGLTQDGKPIPIVPIMEVGLDAGAAITVKGPAGSRVINRQTAGMLVVYSAPADFGNGTPGNFYDPGHYTVTGPGGKDVGTLTGSQDVPATPFAWTNIPPVTKPLDRTQDLTVMWTGGIPGTQVTIQGASGTQSFLCAASVDDGQLIVPSYVLLSLPAASGSLVVQNRLVTNFPAPSGLDVFFVAYALGHNLSLKYQ